MDSLRTNTLFHYPRYMENLKNILSQGLKPNYCREDFNNLLDEFVVGIPMVSFCDIPLTRITNFKKRYGEYAIGLSKQWGIRNGVRPILYDTEDYFIIDYENIKEFRYTGPKGFMSLGEEPDKETQLQIYLDNFLRTFLPYTKKYECMRQGQMQCNYEENEWLYVVHEDLYLNWIWSEVDYNFWRGDGKTKPSSGFEPLRFGVGDINFIILQNEKQVSGFTDYIWSMETFGGDPGKKLTDSDKRMLLTKVIAHDRINSDF